MSQPIFKRPMPGGENEEFSRNGKRPVIFDVLGPDRTTSLLPPGYKLVLYINPTSLSLKFQRTVERIQTKGGFVEQHWGDAPSNLTIEAATGGFMRLYSGMSNVTSPESFGGSRRETLAYDSYLDALALFHNNGSVYDSRGQVAIQGIISVTFDGGVYRGWFQSFSVTESADNPYRFSLSASMDIAEEIQTWRTTVGFNTSFVEEASPPDNSGVVPIVGNFFGGG